MPDGNRSTAGAVHNEGTGTTVQARRFRYATSHGLRLTAQAYAIDNGQFSGRTARTNGASGPQRRGRGGEATGTVSVMSGVATAVYVGDADNASSGSAPLTEVVSNRGGSTGTQTTSATSTGTQTTSATATGSPATSAAAPVLLPPTPAGPSNAFRFARVRVTSRTLRLSFDYPGDGTLDALVTTRRPGASAARLRPGPHRVSVGKLHDSATGAQTKTLRVPLTRRGRRILARRGKLPIRLSLVFTPAGGQSARQAHKYMVRP